MPASGFDKCQREEHSRALRAKSLLRERLEEEEEEDDEGEGDDEEE